MGRSLMVSPPTRGSGVSNPGRQYRQFDTSSSSIWDIGKKKQNHTSLPHNILENQSTESHSYFLLLAKVAENHGKGFNILTL